MMDDGNNTPRRRRRHSAEFKAQVIQACKQPGVSIAATALRYQLNANQVRI
ncbi:transposase, partial [Undibacterium sp. BYS50W]|nr:transposase [Undibacterium rugosum]